MPCLFVLICTNVEKDLSVYYHIPTFTKDFGLGHHLGCMFLIQTLPACVSCSSTRLKGMQFCVFQLAFCVLVMYDATGVRLQAGRQAEVHGSYCCGFVLVQID
ncbi:uncharacterized protein LOC111382894 [Olea europaea var. sylvestris]|uniref:uncharacterized protein LOC111382894 n=1 Tax=Olea europaea var. sylvestris TaxID=158386 RepID=UPI000C1D2BB1|nr:uncharacterized protein LOC111382894 [Olea europaea var. sylvestris]